MIELLLINYEMQCNTEISVIAAENFGIADLLNQMAEVLGIKNSCSIFVKTIAESFIGSCASIRNGINIAADMEIRTTFKGLLICL